MTAANWALWIGLIVIMGVAIHPLAIVAWILGIALSPLAIVIWRRIRRR